MVLNDKQFDMAHIIQDLALLYTRRHLEAKAQNDDQVNPYYDPQGAMDYMLDTYFEALGYITGKTEEYVKALGQEK
ncbi:MAG: hypothetical protein HFG20_05030 [Anaerotruncus sp.]|jgi:hypothetical protein|nr:hypothetical protein [Anaerotruncus sp.]